MEINRIPIKNIVIIGAEGTGKTTLANALLGWDIFPQTNQEIYISTKETASQMLTEHIRLTDTPGYDYSWNTVPNDVYQALDTADTIIVLLDNMLLIEEEDQPVEPEWKESLDAAEKEWKEDQGAQKKMVEKLITKSKTRSIFFVIPYDTQMLSVERISLGDSLQIAKEYYSAMTIHGDAGFFCVDPMKALIGALEADNDAIAQSGISPLKTALYDLKGSCVLRGI